MTCFRPRTVLLGVRTMDDVIWGNIPQKLPKKGHEYAVSSQNAKIFTLQSSDLRSEFRPRKALRGWSAITPKQTQHGWRPPSWKSIWRHISAADAPIWTKFGSRMQNDTPITAKWSRSKPEAEFQYGGHLLRFWFNTCNALSCSSSHLRYF